MPDPDPESSVDHRMVYDWTAVSPSAAVLETLAAATGRDELELTPLYGAVDPDALDALVGGSVDGQGDGRTEVAFTHEGFDVAVGSDGIVTLSRTDDA